MSTDPLDSLLEKLTRGDARAAEEVFLAYEPHLRLVVRRYLSPALRAKFDSGDIVQSIWADLLRGFLVQIPYIVVFLGVAFWWFRRKDVLS